MDRESPIVFDISSDEEPSYGQINDPKCDGLTWLAEILGVAEERENTSDDDSDDVVVLGEVKAPKKSKSSSKAYEEDDDDCVILDGDPDKPVVEESNSRSDSEELLIVSEKGQVACRDYPHPRHLCVTFPFSSTPHEKYCELCHCYVCDKPSPCSLWQSTSSETDHCHATDKVQTWKALRRNSKSGKIASPQPIFPSKPTTIPVALPLPMPRFKPVQPLTAARLCPPRPSSTIHGCSSAVLSAQPVSKQIPSPQFGSGLPNFRFRPSTVIQGQQIRNSNITVTQRTKPVQPFGNSSSRYIPPNPTIFKRPAIIRVPRPTNQPGFGQPNYPRFHSPVPPPPMNQFPRFQVPPRPMSPSYRPVPGPTAVRAPLPQHQVGISQSVRPVGQHIAPVSQSFCLPVYQYPTSEASNSSQNPSLEEVQSPGVSSGSSGGYNPSWVNTALNHNSDGNISQQPTLADNFQPQVVVATESSNQPLLPKDSSSGLGVGNANTSVHRELENWLLETSSAPLSDPLVPVDDSPLMQSNNIYSPESAFFDLATPWSDLTRA